MGAGGGSTRSPEAGAGMSDCAKRCSEHDAPCVRHSAVGYCVFECGHVDAPNMPEPDPKDSPCQGEGVNLAKNRIV